MRRAVAIVSLGGALGLASSGAAQAEEPKAATAALAHPLTLLRLGGELGHRTTTGADSVGRSQQSAVVKLEVLLPLQDYMTTLGTIPALDFVFGAGGSGSDEQGGGSGFIFDLSLGSRWLVIDRAGFDLGVGPAFDLIVDTGRETTLDASLGARAAVSATDRIELQLDLDVVLAGTVYDTDRRVRAAVELGALSAGLGYRRADDDDVTLDELLVLVGWSPG